MELQADLILVELEVEFKEAAIKVKSCSPVSLFVMCKHVVQTGILYYRCCDGQEQHLSILVELHKMVQLKCHVGNISQFLWNCTKW